jgi:hypothetical protein
VLHVVEDEQARPVAQRRDDTLLDWKVGGFGGDGAGGLGDGLQRGRFALRCGERDVDDAVREAVGQASGRHLGEARLADPAGSGQRQQADAGGKESGVDLGHFPLAAEERGRLLGERGRQRACGRR